MEIAYFFLMSTILKIFKRNKFFPNFTLLIVNAELSYPFFRTRFL